MTQNENKIGVIWTRVSSKKQKDNGGSIEHQLDVCRRYAQEQGIEIIKEYGATFESAKVQGVLFKKMIAEVMRNRRVGYLVVYSSDRFGRNVAESIATADKLKASGVLVVAATQEIDARTSQGKFMRNLNFVLAEFDNDVRREKCTAGVRAKVEAGIWCGRTPLGYFSRGRGRHTQFFINEEGELLRQAFIMKLGNTRNCKILEWLANRGIVIRKQQLHKIFVNPFYAGKISHKVLGGAIIEGNQPPLISWAEYERIQEILSSKTGRYTHEKEAPKFPLRKHVFCAEDHTPFTGYTVKKKKLDYYKCNVIGCHSNQRADTMHQKYAELLDEFALPEEIQPIFEKVVKNYINKNNNGLAKNRSILLKNKSEIENNIKKVQMNRAINVIDDEIYHGAIAELNAKKFKIEAELETNNVKLSNHGRHIHEIAATCCKLGYLWRNGTFDICQKIQHLVFPKGVEWDKATQSYRTIEVNAAIDIMRKFSAGYANKKENKLTEKSICPLSCG